MPDYKLLSQTLLLRVQFECVSLSLSVSIWTDKQVQINQLHVIIFKYGTQRLTNQTNKSHESQILSVRLKDYTQRSYYYYAKLG